MKGGGEGRKAEGEEDTKLQEEPLMHSLPLSSLLPFPPLLNWPEKHSFVQSEEEEEREGRGKKKENWGGGSSMSVCPVGLVGGNRSSLVFFSLECFIFPSFVAFVAARQMWDTHVC